MKKNIALKRGLSSATHFASTKDTATSSSTHGV